MAGPRNCVWGPVTVVSFACCKIETCHLHGPDVRVSWHPVVQPGSRCSMSLLWWWIFPWDLTKICNRSSAFTSIIEITKVAEMVTNVLSHGSPVALFQCVWVSADHRVISSERRDETRHNVVDSSVRVYFSLMTPVISMNKLPGATSILRAG